MNLIHNDIARCAGRFGLGPDDPICERRQQCARYRQVTIDSGRDGRPEFISTATGLCQDGDDHMIPMEAEDS